ncbi:hypothetical protein CC80DRAFT_509020 [Byssothecium circinans]|uniref:Mid2 domain-containing protein n=1 Tax=Byssothecium circinans TaxID=147558 RepID=A0A6A5TQC9_9PLEO|nr:hypothetical protein CC80DRAFT_509020 [Byssothecium circinans]
MPSMSKVILASSLIPSVAQAVPFPIPITTTGNISQTDSPANFAQSPPFDWRTIIVGVFGIVVAVTVPIGIKIVVHKCRSRRVKAVPPTTLNADVVQQNGNADASGQPMVGYSNEVSLSGTLEPHDGIARQDSDTASTTNTLRPEAPFMSARSAMVPSYAPEGDVMPTLPERVKVRY